MSLFGAGDIKQLKKLCNAADGSDSEDDADHGGDSGGTHQMGPGDIGTSKVAKKTTINRNPDEHVKASSYAPLQETQTNQPRTVEEWERQQLQESEALLETRPRPDCKISYKQTVSTEDLYLQMGGKTPGTASCENMVVEIFLTGETVGIQHIDLAVQEQRVVVKSPKYHLDLHLPHKVDPDRGNAAWLSDEKILKLTLKMEREYDFVNF